MRIAIALIIVDMGGTYALFHHAKRLMHRTHDVRVAGIETDSQVRIMERLNQLHQPLRG